jgi:hypothetical protein
MTATSSESHGIGGAQSLVQVTIYSSAVLSKFRSYLSSLKYIILTIAMSDYLSLLLLILALKY